MLKKLFFFVVKTIVFLIFLGWLLVEFMLGDMGPAKPENARSDPNSAGGLIIPQNDPRFVNGG